MLCWVVTISLGNVSKCEMVRLVPVVPVAESGAV